MQSPPPRSVSWIGLTGVVIFFSSACAFIMHIVAPRMVGERPGKLVPRQEVLVLEGPTGRAAGTSGAIPFRFTLDNVGGEPAEILSIESGCGCATPLVDTRIVAPGAAVCVTGSASMPAVGQKDVPVTVITNSKVHSHVRMMLRLVTRRDPPFLLSVMGDLRFAGAYSEGLSREFTVVTVERRDERIFHPVPRTDLPFLEIVRGKVEEMPDTRATNALVRKQTYALRFIDRPATDSFAGSVTVPDPWDPGNGKSIGVAAAFIPDDSEMRVVPRSLRLDPSHPIGSITVLCNVAIDHLELRAEDSAESGTLFDLQEKPVGQTGRVHQVQVRLVDPSFPRASRKVQIRRPDTGAFQTVTVSFAGE